MFIIPILLTSVNIPADANYNLVNNNTALLVEFTDQWAKDIHTIKEMIFSVATSMIILFLGSATAIKYRLISKNNPSIKIKHRRDLQLLGKYLKYRKIRPLPLQRVEKSPRYAQNR